MPPGAATQPRTSPAFNGIPPTKIKQFSEQQDVIMLQELLALRPWERPVGEVLDAYTEIAERFLRDHHLETYGSAVYRRVNKLLSEFKYV